MADFDGGDDFFDSRDVIERIAELEDQYMDEDDGIVDESVMDPDEREEYDALVALRDEARDYVPDWEYGSTFISDDYFEDYAKEYARDIGAIPTDLEWPCNRIDWEDAADDLKIDYTSFEFRGQTYWAR